MTDLTDGEVVAILERERAHCLDGCLCILDVPSGPEPSDAPHMVPPDDGLPCTCETCGLIGQKDGDYCASEECDDSCPCGFGEREPSETARLAQAVLDGRADLAKAQLDIEIVRRAGETAISVLEARGGYSIGWADGLASAAQRISEARAEAVDLRQALSDLVLVYDAAYTTYPPILDALEGADRALATRSTNEATLKPFILTTAEVGLAYILTDAWLLGAPDAVMATRIEALRAKLAEFLKEREIPHG